MSISPVHEIKFKQELKIIERERKKERERERERERESQTDR